MEMVDLYDENRLPLGRTAERYAPKGEGEYRVVVHICVFDSRGRLLIQQRSREKAVWPEAWDVSAAGGVDAGDKVVGQLVGHVQPPGGGAGVPGGAGRGPGPDGSAALLHRELRRRL